MKSVLIRFTDKKYISSILEGKLYMSSLGKFWNYKNRNKAQMDFCEGIAATVPKKDTLFPEDMENVIAYDVRYRIEAYKYVNLLCFFRVDIDDERRVIQLPSMDMNDFGNTVLLVNNEHEFIRRVIQAVKRDSGICITGDVRYHSIEDTAEPDKKYNHTISLIVDSKEEESSALFPMKSLPHIQDASHRYGCLDKYIRYANQKEWRVCYLPKVQNEDDIILDVGPIDDIVSVIPTTKIRGYLLSMFLGCVPGQVNFTRKNTKGTMHYPEFKEKIENIDGMCKMIFDIG